MNTGSSGKQELQKQSRRVKVLTRLLCLVFMILLLYLKRIAGGGPHSPGMPGTSAGELFQM
jgi:hypothetical protein